MVTAILLVVGGAMIFVAHLNRVEKQAMRAEQKRAGKRPQKKLARDVLDEELGALVPRFSHASDPTDLDVSTEHDRESLDHGEHESPGDDEHDTHDHDWHDGH